MRNIIYMLMIAIMTSACKGDDSPKTDTLQRTIDQLSQSWKATKVTFEKGDVTSDWTGFLLTFHKDQKYTATALSAESRLVWPVTGSYSFPDPKSPHTVERNDGIEVTIEHLSESTVRLAFQLVADNKGGRQDALVGEWIFEMQAE